MNLNKVKHNFIYIIISIIIFVAIIFFSMFLSFSKNNNVKTNHKSNVSVKKYYAKSSPVSLSGFSVDEIGKSLFVSITGTPCTYYRTQAINYLNKFKKPSSPEVVNFTVQGNGVGASVSCYKNYILK